MGLVVAGQHTRVLKFICVGSISAGVAGPQSAPTNQTAGGAVMGALPVGHQNGYAHPSVPHEEIEVWAPITAPPPHVQEVTLVFDNTAAPIDDVPIEP